MADHDQCSAAVQDLLLLLPENLKGLWLNVSELHGILKQGGFSLLPKSVVVNCLKGNRQDSPQRNKHGSKPYYQYGDTTNKPKCFKKQRDAGISIPKFVDGFYTQEGSNFFSNHVKLLKSKEYCGASVQDSPLVHNPPELSENDTENKKPAGLKIVDMDVKDSFIKGTPIGFIAKDVLIHCFRIIVAVTNYVKWIIACI
jgi:hypothetical protein